MIKKTGHALKSFFASHAEEEGFFPRWQNEAIFYGWKVSNESKLKSDFTLFNFCKRPSKLKVGGKSLMTSKETILATHLKTACDQKNIGTIK